MKPLLYLLILCFSLLIYKCNIPKKTENKSTDSLFIQYHFSAETAFVDISITGNQLVKKHLPESFKCPDNFVAQMPCYGEKDLVTEKKNLSKQQTDHLTELVKNSGVLNLNGNYGGASENQRYYPHLLNIKLNSKEYRLVYQSFPEAKPMPDEMKKVMDEILNLSN